MLLLTFIFIVVSGVYTAVVYRIGIDRGRQRLYEAALEIRQRDASGEDLSVEACLERNARKNRHRIFRWGEEALPGLRFYGLCFCGFQVGYWDKKW